MEIREIIETLETKKKERIEIIDESRTSIFKLRLEKENTPVRDALIERLNKQIDESFGYIEALDMAINLLKK